jgi:hypothetical protein
VWNEAGASFDFSIDPAYYQTTWFRLYQIAREFNARLEEQADATLLRFPREVLPQAPFDSQHLAPCGTAARMCPYQGSRVQDDSQPTGV